MTFELQHTNYSHNFVDVTLAVDDLDQTRV